MSEPSRTWLRESKINVAEHPPRRALVGHAKDVANRLITAVLRARATPAPSLPPPSGPVMKNLRRPQIEQSDTRARARGWGGSSWSSDCVD